MLDNRAEFGHWLSGFVDGEGYFQIRQSPRSTKSYCGVFRIQLRADDRQILNAIMDYFGCGGIYPKSSFQHHRKSNPTRNFMVAKNSELVSMVLPHFEKFPLRSKKYRDYELWREAVLEIESIRNRVVIEQDSRRQIRWSKVDTANLRELCEKLKSTRSFVDNSRFIE